MLHILVLCGDRRNSTAAGTIPQSTHHTPTCCMHPAQPYVHVATRNADAYVCICPAPLPLSYTAWSRRQCPHTHCSKCAMSTFPAEGTCRVLQGLWSVTELEGNLRLMGGEANASYAYGRLEIFLRGLWSSVCDSESFTPDAALVACRILGYDGGAPLQFGTPPFGQNQVLSQRSP